MAGTSFGYNAFLGFAEESTYGTFVAPAKWLRVNDFDFKEDYKAVAKPTLGYASQNRFIGSKLEVSGSFTFQCPLTGWELLVKHAMGALNTTGSTNYVHTCSLASALPTGLSFHASRDNSALSTYYRYPGCQIDKLTLKQDMEEYLLCTVDVLGKNESVNATSVSPTYPSTTDYFDYTQVAATINSVSYSLKNLEFTIENTLAKDRYFLGSRERGALGRGGYRKVSAKFDVELSDVTLPLHAAYLAKTNLGGANTTLVWTVGANKTLSIKFASANVQVQSASGQPKEAGPIILNCEVETFSSSTGNDEVTIEIANQTATP